MQVLDMLKCDVVAEKKKIRRQPDTNIRYAIPHLVPQKGIQPRWALVQTDSELKEFKVLVLALKALVFFKANKHDAYLYPVYSAVHSALWSKIRPLCESCDIAISGAYLKDIAKI